MWENFEFKIIDEWKNIILLQSSGEDDRAD